MGVDHVVLLNWNAADETVECLRNLRDMEVSAKIIVADNASGDNSLVVIQDWMTSVGARVLLLREEDLQSCSVNPSQYDMVLIANSGNHGFAGGNNPAIRFAAERDDSDVIWLLNNDARVDRDTYPMLRARLKSDPSIGFAGSVIRYFEDPDRLQCFGGVVIHPLLGKRSLYKKNLHIDRLGECNEADVDCLMGASLAIRSEVIRSVGVMEEAYFMYAEEVDWQVRAKKAGWNIAVEPKSYLFHKGAQSTKGRSHMYHYYLNRASVMFSKRFYGLSSMLTVVPSLLSILLVRNWREPKSILFGVKGVIDGLRFQWKLTGG